MDRTGQYQGSQAFTHLVPSEIESVNPNTGSLNCKMPLIKLRGIRDSIDLNLNLSYSIGTAGTFGLPDSWSLDLPYVLEDKSLTLNGRTYAIDFGWSDINHHPSGLRYLNNHGIKFQAIVPPQPLPSGMRGLYGYKLYNVDGSSDYFDVMGKPLEHSDIYGNYIYYAYLPGAEAGVDNKEVKLDYIQDSWGQKIQFRYQTGVEVSIILPNQNHTSIMFSSVGVTAIVDPEDLRTTFEYTRFSGDETVQTLSTIHYPTGLTSRYDYGQIVYLTQNGTSKNMPAVQNHYNHDSDSTFYRHTEYVFGGLSGNSYTGASIGVKMTGATDGLMDGNNNASTFTYDVVKTSYDEDKAKLARTCTWFNNYHLPTQEIRYLLDGDDQFVEAYKTIYTYRIDENEQARTTNYAYPVCTETLHNVGTQTSPTYQPLTLSTTEYNEYGNQLSASEQLYVTGSGYIKQTTTQNTYTTTALNIQILTESTHQDEVAKTEDRTESVPTADGRAVDSTSILFRPSTTSSSELQPWTKRSFKYDDKGRIISKTLAWAPGAKVPEGSVGSVENRIEYSFTDGTLTQTGFDAANNATVFEYDVKTYLGPMIRKTLPLGQVEVSEYDKIGRLTKQTDALGYTTTTAYTIGPMGSTQKVTSPLGYVILSKFDVLDRETEVLDNGDPTQTVDAEATRLQSRKSYDFQSRVRESTDKLGLTTKYTYDAMDRPLAVTDPKGNVLEHKYDDVGLSVTQSVNNDVRIITQLNGRSDQISIVKVPDSEDEATDYCIVEETTYDGNRRETNKTLSQKPKTEGSAVLLRRTETEYGAESTVIGRTITGSSDGGQDAVKRQFTLDILGNTYSWIKHTTYADGRTFEHHGPVDIYDHGNRLSLTRNQLGKEESSTYDANGWLEKTVRPDGSQVVYTCDDVGNTIKTEYPSSTTEFSYNEDGRLYRVKEGDDVIEYQSALDGTLTGVKYGNGSSQSYTLDKLSRAVKETDVFGVVRETQFKDTGEVASRSCKGDTVTYQYGSANHTYGQYLGCSVEGGRNYEVAILYDGHNRLRKSTVKDSSSKTLLDTTYDMDGIGKLQSLKSKSELVSDQNYERTLAYDGIGQLVKDAVGSSTTTYRYDGNSNVTGRGEDSQSLTAMTFNELDQRADDGFEYDDNGRMTRDNQGYQYKFDDRDRLVFVQRGDGATNHFEYRADEYLAGVQGPSESATMYHSSGKFNAMEVTSSSGGEKSEKTSLFSGSKYVVASYTSGDDNGNEKASEYFLDSLGSTALILGQDKNVSATYDAYGVPRSSATAVDLRSSFAFAQEYFDQLSSLVYLRARYYSPKHMAFISMDRYRQENRYAYCEGDPINNIDPLGLSWWSWLATAVGVVVAGIVTMGVGWAVGAALGFAGVSAATAATASAVIGGAAGSVAGAYASSRVSGTPYTWHDALIDAVVGGSAGLVGRLVEPVAEGWAKGMSELGKSTFTSAVTNSAEEGTSALLRPILTGQPVDPSQVGLAMLKGFFAGAAKGYAKGQYRSLSPRARAAVRQLVRRKKYNLRGTTSGGTSGSMKELSGIPELVTFSKTKSFDADVSEASSVVYRPRFKGLREYAGEGEEGYGLDNPLLLADL